MPHQPKGDEAMPTSRTALTSAELRDARDRWRVTGEWLATRLGVTARTVRRWENGTALIPPDTGAKLAELERTFEEFVTSTVAHLRQAGPDDADEWWVITYRDDVAYRAEYPDLDWPAGWHRAAMGEVARRLPGVRIEYHPGYPDGGGTGGGT